MLDADGFSAWRGMVKAGMSWCTLRLSVCLSQSLLCNVLGRYLSAMMTGVGLAACFSPTFYSFHFCNFLRYYTYCGLSLELL